MGGGERKCAGFYESSAREIQSISASVGDDGERDKLIAMLYFDLATAYNENNYNGIIILKARIEKEEAHRVNEERHPLYSQRKGKILTFADKIVELNDMYDDLIFQLSDSSNESMREVKTYSTEEIIKFEKRVIEKIRRKNKNK